jgi:biotin-dependent carboxylase-like uncharacterized protein
MRNALVVERVGHATVQDLGRTGWTRLGVSGNGAADTYSARVANTLVGNAESAPLIEVTGSVFTVAACSPLLVAVTGAAQQITVDGRLQPAWEAVVVEPGRRLTIEMPRHGLRSYLALNGALAADYLLGSVAPDPLLGAAGHLAVGDVLRVESRFEMLDHPHFRLPLFRFGAERPALSDSLVVDVTPGPDAGRFDARLDEMPGFTVSPQSDHIGLRLLGTVPDRSTTTEILSRGVAVGAIEIPPVGGLIVLLRGQPVTAGYPVVGVATATSLDLLGQVRPGDSVSFRVLPETDAIDALRRRRRHLEDLAQRVGTAYRHVGLGHLLDAGHLARREETLMSGRNP